MKNETIKEGRRTRKLTLHSETLRTLDSTELQGVVGATGFCSGRPDCGSLECIHD